MTPLEPTVSSTKARTENACALTRSSHYSRLETICFIWVHPLLTCLLSCRPKGLGDVRGQRTAADSGGVPVLCDLDTLELVQPNFDSALHPPDCADGPMAAVGGEERDIELSRKFHLYHDKPLRLETTEEVRQKHTVSATSFSVPGTTTTLTVGVSYDDHRDVAKSKAAVSLG